jgi:riboflavin synthase|tara:strand:- start:761 stop:1363 length:603 start_codon:yes stop_codon:yes gene_type:complete
VKKLFTGIVEDVGKIEKKILQKTGEYLIRIKCNMLNTKNFKLGESIAVNGVCLTVTKSGKTYFETLASLETLSKTNLGNKSVNDHVNLERAMKANGRFGGHIVSGHVDTLGKVTNVKKAGKSVEYWFRINKKLTKYIIEKGSITIDGISLTINRVRVNTFSVNIIPHTSQNTISNSWLNKSEVNLEFDMIAKYIEKMVKK